MSDPDLALQSAHYACVARAIAHLRAHATSQPSLAEVAAAAGLSEHHLQRVFSAWAGVSPKRFLQFLTKEHALDALGRGSALDAALDAGLSGPGRLHDLMVQCVAMTPGEIRAHGAGVVLHHGSAVTPFGPAFIAWTVRGICFLAFHEGDDAGPLAELCSDWPLADVQHDAAGAAAWAARIFTRTPGPGELHVVLRGTNFQLAVWQALLRVAPGAPVSYARLSAMAGAPRAHRAVGSALAANRVSYLIPCHRVIRGSGESGHYRWGADRKRALLAWESAQLEGEGAGAGVGNTDGESAGLGTLSRR